MSKWEAFKGYLENGPGWISRGTCDCLLRRMNEFEASEVKERPDGSGRWWYWVADASDWSMIYLHEDTDADHVIDRSNRWIKADKPMFPEPEKEGRDTVETLADEHGDEEPATLSPLREAENQLRAELVELQSHVIGLAAKVEAIARANNAHGDQITDIECHLNLIGNSVHEPPDDRLDTLSYASMYLNEVEPEKVETRPWMIANEYNELPGGLCCRRANGGICFEHDRRNYEPVWTPEKGLHWKMVYPDAKPNSEKEEQPRLKDRPDSEGWWDAPEGFPWPRVYVWIIDGVPRIPVNGGFGRIHDSWTGWALVGGTPRDFDIDSGEPEPEISD